MRKRNKWNLVLKMCLVCMGISGVVVITTAQLHSTKPELRFCAGSNPARGVLEIRDGEDLWQWPQLEIRLNAFCQSTIPQKNSSIQFNSWFGIRIFWDEKLCMETWYDSKIIMNFYWFFWCDFFGWKHN